MADKGSRRMRAQRSPIWAKIVVGFGALLMVAALASGGYAKYMIDNVNDSVPTKDLGIKDDPGGDIKGPLNFLLIGSDKRKSWSSSQSDTIMVLHVNRDLNKATIVSIPRDLKVHIRKCAGGNPCDFKINSAFAAGGKDTKAAVQNLARTIKDLSSTGGTTGQPTKDDGIEFNGVAMVNFKGFYKVAKMFGTIKLCLPLKMTPDHGHGKTFPKGCNDYSYKDALLIVRERHSYFPEGHPDFDPSWGLGDYGRQHMQQQFIKQLFVRAEEEGYVSNPAKVGPLIKTLGSNVLVDLGHRSVTDFAFALRHVKPSSMKTLRLPSTTVVEYPGGTKTDFEELADDQAKQTTEDLFKAIREDNVDEWIADNPKLVNREDK
jgi:anionic cell wall polymer biosynthesis LytR-Cps2A-Psr (LCP) family protein